MFKKNTIIFILIVLGSLMVWRVMDKGVLVEHAALAGKFESAVNELLSQQGIQDKHILKNVRIEHKTKFPTYSSWIETEREILLPSKRILPGLNDRLKSAAKKHKMNFFSSEPYFKTSTSKQNGSVIEMGKRDKIFQRIIFIYP